MRELRYGSEMQDYTCDNKCYINILTLQKKNKKYEKTYSKENN